MNLTTEGTADWAVWGFTDGSGEQCNTPGACSTSLAPDVSKSGGTASATSPTSTRDLPIPLRGIGFVAPQPFTFSWSDGSPTPSETDAETGLQHNGGPPHPAWRRPSTLGTASASPFPRTRPRGRSRSGSHSTGPAASCTATLSDGSADGLLGLVQRRNPRLRRRCLHASRTRRPPPEQSSR